MIAILTVVCTLGVLVGSTLMLELNDKQLNAWKTKIGGN